MDKTQTATSPKPNLSLPLQAIACLIPNLQYGQQSSAPAIIGQICTVALGIENLFGELTPRKKTWHGRTLILYPEPCCRFCEWCLADIQRPFVKLPLLYLDASMYKSKSIHYSSHRIISTVPIFISVCLSKHNSFSTFFQNQTHFSKPIP